MNALGVDVSKYNGPVEWQVAKDNGVVFAGMRATISWGYRDPWLAYNLSENKRLGIFRFPYHVLYPGENVARQVDNFMGACNLTWEFEIPVLDLELTHGQTKQTITLAAVSWLEQIEAKTGKKPIIYSRKSWIDSYTVNDMWRTRYDWWLAHYLNDRTVERPAPPAKPSSVVNWLIHQNCDHKLAWAGFAATSADFIRTVDIDRWNGDDSAVAAYFGAVVPPVPVCPCCGRPL